MEKNFYHPSHTYLMDLLRKSLEGKVGIVAGVGMGQGKAVVKALLDNGAKVFAFSRTQKDIGITDRNFKMLKGDSTVKEDVLRIAGEVARDEEIVDLLYNNHGFFSSGDSTEFGSALPTFFSRNVMGSVNTINVFHKMMKRGGSIVNVGASRSIFRKSSLEYAVSKYSVEEMTLKFSSILMGKNIRVNAILPGNVDSSPDTDVSVQQTPKGAGDKRNVTPTEVANVALFLLSDMSSGITGQCITVDREM
jgi:NAD(P)-dependent dehydrogenase (short-subunit alcohol dehydrogenase family)